MTKLQGMSIVTVSLFSNWNKYSPIKYYLILLFFLYKLTKNQET